MADNTTLNAGSGGDVVASDDIGGVKFQRVKLIIGADGVNNGDVASGNPLPVSAASLPLPTGASTAAKQPALGTAGAASADVVTVQGVASMTALKVDGSAVTQPISAASLPLPTGAATAANQTTVGSATTKINDGTTSGTVKAASTAAVATDTALVVAISPNNTVPVSAASWLGSTAPTVGQKTMANSLPVVIASDQSAVPVSGTVTANIGTSGSLALDATLTGGTQKTKIVDGSGAQIASLTDTNALGLVVALGATNFPLSTANTSTAQLAASATFTGTVETIFNAQAISVLLTSDQPGTLILNQYIDAGGTRKASAFTFSVLANAGFSRSFVANGNFFNLSFQNTGASTTTTLNINTAFGILPSQTSLGNAPIAINEINGTITSSVTAAGTMPVGITDGTRVATIKAASTAAVAADPAIVVAISPNNTVTVAGADTTGSGTLNALNATAQVVLAGLNGAGMQLLAGTLIGTIVPEISVDGGTTWVSSFFDDPTTGNKAASIVFAGSNTATTRTLVGVGGASHARVRVSAFTSGTATCNVRASATNDPSLLPSGAAAGALPPVALQVGGSDGTLLRALATDVSGRLVVSIVDGQKTTYSAATTSLVPAAAATDLFTITGSASKTVRITKITVSATQTTAGELVVILAKRSTANSAGTSTASTAVPHDSNNAAATATVLAYTANPTTGTLVGNMRSEKFFAPALAGASMGEKLYWDFGNRPGQGVVLRGTAQVLALNLNGATVAGGSFGVSVEFTEE